MEVRGEVRIIGGKFRGRALSFPPIQDLRPTPNRVKETLFNWLMHDIPNARCLDAFAGSGSLGFEALSRGAKEVVMVESSSEAYTALARNAAGLSADNVSLVRDDALNYLENTQDPFDIIFLDPPFQGLLLEQCLTILAERPCLKTQGLVSVESAQEIVLDPKNWRARKAKKAGQVYYALFEKIG